MKTLLGIYAVLWALLWPAFMWAGADPLHDVWAATWQSALCAAGMIALTLIALALGLGERRRPSRTRMNRYAYCYRQAQARGDEAEAGFWMALMQDERARG